MPDWTNQVPKDPRGYALPIQRTPANRPLQAIITSPDLIGCYTHFWHGSTVPCTLPDCEPHRDGIPFRWHAYMSAVDLFNHLHFIFEVTAIGATHFTTYREQHGTIRGCQFISKRWKSRPNGRLLIQTKPADLAEINIPAAPDLKKCMAIIWSLPETDVATNGINPEQQTPQIRIHPKTDENQ